MRASNGNTNDFLAPNSGIFRETPETDEYDGIVCVSTSTGNENHGFSSEYFISTCGIDPLTYAQNFES